jgi:alkaline phosphatase D
MSATTRRRRKLRRGIVRRLLAWNVAASLVLTACGETMPTPPVGATPTPCPGLLLCSAGTPGPIRTLPPIATAPPGPTSGSSNQTFRIAIGACLRLAAGGHALEEISAHDPDVMLWLGDNIYADTEDMSEMRALYEKLAENPRFEALAESTEMMAVWDDHDMGWNNANATWPHRDAAKAEFLRFWDAASEVPPSDQPGVYSARTFGTGDRTVQVILLDTRYNLDPWDYEGKDPSRRVLGEKQWAWLRERLLEPATVRIIGSGIQVVQDYDIDREWEGWGDSPHERDRLFDLVRALRIPGVVFVSGDMHFAELTRHPDDAAALGYPTYDLTPSGLDQVETAGIGQWVNPNRVGELLNSIRKHGLVEIDWEPVDPEIHLEIYDRARLHLDHVVQLSELQPDKISASG